MKQMNVIYAANENYAKLVWISASSLFENNKDYTIKLYLISDNILPDSIQKIDQLVRRHGNKLVVIDFSEISYGLENAQIFSGSKTTYARLFLPDIIPEEKILYLDCDTLIMDSLNELWCINMEDYYVAGVQDMVVPHIRYDIDLDHTAPYLNAGILLMNIKKMKSDGLQEKFIDYIKVMNGAVPCHDQGVINHVCKGGINVITPEYNVMTPMFYYSANEIKSFYELEDYYTNHDIEVACEKPKIIHFTAGWYVRPWFVGSKHPYAKIYKNYYLQSPWGAIPMQKGTIHKKIQLMKLLYKILPFALFVTIAKWKRKYRGKVSNGKTN